MAKSTQNLTPQYRLPVNPELSRAQHSKDLSKAFIIHAHTYEFLGFLDELKKKNPFKYAEMMFNRFPDLLQQQGTQLVINLPPLPQGNGAVPGVIASPIRSQLSAPLTLVPSQVETIEQGDD